MEHEVYIGTSGWSYKHWEGTFYPEKLPKKKQFDYYRERFGSVEINNSFYRLPPKETMLKWKDQAQQGFGYVLKASRFITHMKQLNDPEQSLEQFLEHAEALGDKLLAILFQLPPRMKINLAKLEAFVSALPTNHRCVFEFRNSEWYNQQTYDLLRKYNCAFCIYELDGHLSPIETTADFVYLRLHGPGRKYQGSYSDQNLEFWAAQIRTWRESKDVFVYFDNDENGYAAFNALRLQDMIAA